MEPTVGRIVHYFTQQNNEQSNGQGEGPYAALIVQVHSATCCSLRVFPPFADSFMAGSVMLADQGNKPFKRWEWPARV